MGGRIWEILETRNRETENRRLETGDRRQESLGTGDRRCWRRETGDGRKETGDCGASIGTVWYYHTTELGARVQNNVVSCACASFSNGVASRAITHFSTKKFASLVFRVIPYGVSKIT